MREGKRDGRSLTCRDCGMSYDWQLADANGRPMLCRCPVHKEAKYCKFLSDPACRRFVPREG